MAATIIDRIISDEDIISNIESIEIDVVKATYIKGIEIIVIITIDSVTIHQ
jgi:hypothetical protein